MRYVYLLVYEPEQTLTNTVKLIKDTVVFVIPYTWGCVLI